MPLQALTDSKNKYLLTRCNAPQVLKVPPTNPLAWQTSLIDSEVDSILDGGIFGKTKEMRNGGAHGSGGDERTARDNGITFAGRQHRRDFLRRGGGRTSAGGDRGLREGGSGGDGGGGAEGTGGGGTRRLDIVPGEVCPVCQEEMEEEGEREVGLPIAAAAAAAAADGRLTYCRDGCGNNMHARYAGGPERTFRSYAHKSALSENQPILDYCCCCE